MEALVLPNDPFGVLQTSLLGASFFNQTLEITSGSSVSFLSDTSNSFQFTTTGAPAASLDEAGVLPDGVTFLDNGDGTATLSGSPQSDASGC